jgi:hypothetical protein
MQQEPLAYLDFDYSDDEEGHGTFDAMAAADPRALAALQSEVVRVLAWAHAGFGSPAPLEEGGEWDCQLAGVRELTAPLSVQYDPAAGALALNESGPALARVTLTLTLTGTPTFCAALRTAFGVA